MNCFMAINRVLTLLFLGIYLGISPGKAQNSEWKCVKRADSILVYARKSDSANYRIIKATTQVKTTLSSLVLLLIDSPHHKDWVFMNKKAEILEKKNPYSWILYSQTDAPWPVTDRDIITKANLMQDPVTKTVTIRGEAIPDYLPKDPEHVRIPYARAQWYFIPEKDSLVKVEFTLEIDVGGNIPQWLANMTATKGPYQTLRGLRKEINQKKYRNAHLKYIMEP